MNAANESDEKELHLPTVQTLVRVAREQVGQALAFLLLLFIAPPLAAEVRTYLRARHELERSELTRDLPRPWGHVLLAPQEFFLGCFMSASPGRAMGNESIPHAGQYGQRDGSLFRVECGGYGFSAEHPSARCITPRISRGVARLGAA